MKMLSYGKSVKIVENELDFQKDITTNFQNSLYNIYDINFTGQNINATGLCKEIQGNVLSSLFTKIKTNKYENNHEIKQLFKHDNKHETKQLFKLQFFRPDIC